MDDKIFRKANTVSSRSAGDGLNTETGTGRVVIKAAGVDEETNPYGRSLIKLRKRGDEENEPNEEGSDEYGDMPNTGGLDNRKNARRLKLAKGPMVASGIRSIQNAQRVRGKINKLGRKDNANSQKSHLKSEKLSKRQEKVLTGGRSRVIKATYKAADDEKPVSRKRGAIGKEYDKILNGPAAGVNNRLAYMQRRVYVASTKTIKENTTKIARIATMGRYKGKDDKKEDDNSSRNGIARKNGLRNKKRKKKDDKDNGGKDKKSRKGKLLSKGGKLLTGSYVTIGFGGNQSNEGKSADEMGSRMTMALVLFIKFIALTLVIIDIVAKLLLLILTVIICIIVVIVVNVSLIAIIIAVVIAIVAAIIAFFLGKKDDDDDDDDDDGGVLRYVMIDDAYFELENAYENTIKNYVNVGGYDGYIIEGEKASSFDIIETWCVVVGSRDFNTYWISAEENMYLENIYWTYNHLEISTEIRVEQETITYTDGNGDEHEIEIPVNKKYLKITASAMTMDEVNEKLDIIDVSDGVFNLMGGGLHSVYGMYVSKIEGNEYELPVGEVKY